MKKISNTIQIIPHLPGFCCLVATAAASSNYTWINKTFVIQSEAEQKWNEALNNFFKALFERFSSKFQENSELLLQSQACMEFQSLTIAVEFGIQ